MSLVKEHTFVLFSFWTLPLGQTYTILRLDTHNAIVPWKAYRVDEILCHVAPLAHVRAGLVLPRLDSGYSCNHHNSTNDND